MKKWIALLMALLAFCAPALAEGDWYLTTAGELTVMMGELVQDETYQQTMTFRSLDCVKEIQDADFSAAARVYRTTFPVQKVSDWLRRQGGDLNDLSDTARKMIISSVPQMLMTQYNGGQSADKVAAGSILTVSRTYVMPEGFEDCLLILELDGAVAGAAFMATGENTVTVQVQPLFCGESGTVEEVLRQIKDAGVFCDFRQIQ